MNEAFGEKSLSPTPRRLAEARREGHVPRSADLSAACVLLGVILGAGYFTHVIFEKLLRLMERSLSLAVSGESYQPVAALSDISFAMTGIVHAFAPAVVCVMVLVVVSGMAQVGCVFTPKVAAPRWSRISPIQGARRLISIESFVRSAMGLAKIVIVTGIVGFSVVREHENLIALLTLNTRESASAMGEWLWTVALRLAVGLLALAALDYLFQRWQHRRSLMMSRQEVVEELKRTEGDPRIRHQRSRAGRQRLFRNMVRQTPGADVVIADQGECCVALRYSVEHGAPRLVAKGVGRAARRMLELAEAHGVVVVRESNLATRLYRTIDPGHSVLTEHFDDVAAIFVQLHQRPDIGRDRA